MRSVCAALAASLPVAALGLAALAATPAAAQDCDCGPGAYTETGPATLVVPRTTFVPHTRYTERTVLVPRTRLVRRVVYVPRTRLVPRTVAVPRTVYSARTTYTAYPAEAAGYAVAGIGYPAGYHYGATYVPPGAAYGCTLGTVGCDSSFVGPLGW